MQLYLIFGFIVWCKKVHSCLFCAFLMYFYELITHFAFEVPTYLVCNIVTVEFVMNFKLTFESDYFEYYPKPFFNAIQLFIQGGPYVSERFCEAV